MRHVKCREIYSTFCEFILLGMKIALIINIKKSNVFVYTFYTLGDRKTNEYFTCVLQVRELQSSWNIKIYHWWVIVSCFSFFLYINTDFVLDD